MSATTIVVETSDAPEPVSVDVHDIELGTFFSGSYGVYGSSTNEGAFFRFYGGLVFFPKGEIGDRGLDCDEAGNISWAWDEDDYRTPRFIHEYKKFSHAKINLRR
jgi:hypothetical protein